MLNLLWRSLPAVLVLAVGLGAAPAAADEIWVAPTSQNDFGGIGIASNTFWPVTPAGAVRFAFAVPADFQVFRSTKVALIPHTSSASSTLNVFVCSATHGALVGAACSGPT